MNYIKQLNAFWKRRQLEPMSSGDADFYMTLLHFANISGWKKEFNVPNRMLGASCGIEKSELYRRRNRLIRDGLIHYKSGRKGTAGRYMIVPLYDEGREYPLYGTNNAISSRGGNSHDTHISTNRDTYNSTSINTNRGNIHKEKENTNKSVNEEAAATTFARLDSFEGSDAILSLWSDAGFGDMNQYTMGVLSAFVKNGMSVDCVLYAIGEANDNNIRTLSYVRSILNRLKKDGITTKEQLDGDSYKKQNNSYSANKSNSFKEIELPPDDYFVLNNSWDEL